MENAEFGLYDNKGNLLVTYITDSDGKAVIDNLLAGYEYSIKEINRLMDIA